MTHLECYLFNLYYNLYYLGENIKDYQRISNWNKQDLYQG